MDPMILTPEMTREQVDALVETWLDTRPPGLGGWLPAPSVREWIGDADDMLSAPAVRALELFLGVDDCTEDVDTEDLRAVRVPCLDGGEEYDDLSFTVSGNDETVRVYMEWCGSGGRMACVSTPDMPVDTGGLAELPRLVWCVREHLAQVPVTAFAGAGV